MKHKTYITSIIIILLFTNIFAGDEAMSGITTIPSFTGPGIGYRTWITPEKGWDVRVQPSWDFSDFYFNGTYMLTVSTGQIWRTYGFGNVGYAIINEKENGVNYDVSFLTYAVGIGEEKLVGLRKNWGIGYEVGYQGGSGDYTVEMDYFGQQLEMEGTFEIPSFYLELTGAYYFEKK